MTAVFAFHLNKTRVMMNYYRTLLAYNSNQKFPGFISDTALGH